MYESLYNTRHNVRAESGLVIGDQILVVTQPSAKYKNNKLHPTFEGPFPVVFQMCTIAKVIKYTCFHINRV